MFLNARKEHYFRQSYSATLLVLLIAHKLNFHQYAYKLLCDCHWMCRCLNLLTRNALEMFEL